MLQIFYDKHIYNATLETLHAIRRSKDTRHIVLTPDRMNQNIQNIIFDVLGADSLFDVDVTTLSRLANKEIADQGLNNMILSKAGGIAIVRSIMQQHQSELVVFGKNGNNGASNIYDTICQLKSCNITPAMLDENTSSNILNNKLKDIATIYRYYEEYLKGDFTDSFNRLHLFCELTKRLDYKNTYFYFVGFEDLTSLQYDVIFALEKASRGVMVSALYDKGNKSLCPNNNFLNLVDLAHIRGVVVETTKSREYLGQTASFVMENWSNEKTHKVASNIKIGCGITSSDEVEYVAREIVQRVDGGQRYKDFVILCSDISRYKDTVEKIFNKYHLPYFIDMATPLKCVNGISFLYQIFDAIKAHFDKDSILCLLSNIYIDFDRDRINTFANFCEKYGIVYNALEYSNVKENFADIISVLTPILEFANTSASDFCQINASFRTMLDVLQYRQKIEQITQKYINGEQYDKSRELSQIYKKLDTLLNELDNVLDSYSCSVGDYLDILKSCMNDMTVSIPPVVYDTIMVADMTTSYIPYTKDLIILGAIDGKMPTYKMDMGLISDIDVSRLTFKKMINPTIAMLNKRNKYRNIMNTVMFEDGLLVTYPSIDDEGKPAEISPIIARLSALVDYQFVNIAKALSLYEDDTAKNIVYHNMSAEQSKKNFVATLSNLISKDSRQTYLGTLKKVLGNSAKIYEDSVSGTAQESIKNGSKIYFKKHASVSEFETYFSCPYKHFIRYGLRLKEKESSKIDGRIVGNIIHKFVYFLVPNINVLHEYSTDEINSMADSVLDYVLGTKEFCDYVSDINNHNNILSLKKEARRIAQALVEQFALSKYRTSKKWLECQFGPEQNNSIVLKTKYKDVYVMGVVDRVDILDDTFRIIDYKTGSDKFSYSDIASGKKLQLIVYVYAINKATGYRPVGAFYMPISNDYSDSDSGTLYTLDGLISNMASDIKNMDSSVTMDKGKVLKVAFTKNGNINGKYAKKVVGSDQMLELCQYVVDMMRQASEKIMDGDISHTPLSDSKTNDEPQECEYCKYKGMCKKIEGRKANKASNIQEVLNG